MGSTVSLLGRAEGLTSTRTARELVSAESSFRLGSVLRRPAVLEFGARYVRAGFAGECGPRVCVDAPVRGMSRLFTQLITHAAASRALLVFCQPFLDFAQQTRRDSAAYSSIQGKVSAFVVGLVSRELNARRDGDRACVVVERVLMPQALRRAIATALLETTSPVRCHHGVLRVKPTTVLLGRRFVGVFCVFRRVTRGKRAVFRRCFGPGCGRWISSHVLHGSD